MEHEQFFNNISNRELEIKEKEIEEKLTNIRQNLLHRGITDDYKKTNASKTDNINKNWNSIKKEIQKRYNDGYTFILCENITLNELVEKNLIKNGYYICFITKPYDRHNGVSNNKYSFRMGGFIYRIIQNIGVIYVNPTKTDKGIENMKKIPIQYRETYCIGLKPYKTMEIYFMKNREAEELDIYKKLHKEFIEDINTKHNNLEGKMIDTSNKRIEEPIIEEPQPDIVNRPKRRRGILKQYFIVLPNGEQKYFRDNHAKERYMNTQKYKKLLRK